MSDRVNELLELAACGDDEIALQVESEFALMTETRAERLAAAERMADEMADEYAPAAAALPDEEVDLLADEAGF